MITQRWTNPDILVVISCFGAWVKFRSINTNAFMCPCCRILRHSEPFGLVKQEVEGSGGEEHHQFRFILFVSFLHISKHNMPLCTRRKKKNSKLRDTGSCCIVGHINKRIQKKRGRCVQLSGYTPVISAERASRRQWRNNKKKKLVP